jgi:transcriptional regulator with XRE-family HTH domain
MEELARHIRSHRTAQKLSQRELAERAGTSHSAISRIESGRHRITVDTLQRIAQALGVDLILTFESGGRRRVRRSVRLERP